MMKRLNRILALVLAALMLLTGVAMGDEVTGSSPADLARTALEETLSGQYEAVESRFTDDMLGALEAQGGLKAVMEGVLAWAGDVVSIEDVEARDTQGTTVAVFLVTFENMALNATVAVDADNRVAALMFTPRTEAALSVLPDGVSERLVTVDAGTGYPLEGVLTAAETGGPFPAVLLVWGSGASDRDEAVGANRVFAQLASGLAARGIASLRFDKRTHTYPEVQAAADYSVKEEYEQDVLAALNVLKGDPNVDASRVVLLGHSQGGMLAPRLVHAGADVAGLVLLAGTPRLLSDVLYDQQMAATDGAQDTKAMYDAWKAEADALYAMTEDEAKAHAPLYGGAFPAYYLYDLARYDAIELIEAQKTPVLILQGGKDVQVLADADFGRYEAALSGAPYASLKLYPTLNHLFMPSVATDFAEAMLEYAQPAEIPEEVLDDIAAFVKAR